MRELRLLALEGLPEIAAGDDLAAQLSAALARGGLTFEDIELVYMGFPQQAAALRNKAIDAAMMTEPSITNAVDAGVAVKVADYNDFYPNQQTSVLLYSEKFIKERRETASRFMRAYVKIVNERPPGNVHAGQKFWVSRLPKLGDRLTTRLSCTGKEIKSNRRWVTFDANTVDAAGQLLFRGQMKTIWAA